MPFRAYAEEWRPAQLHRPSTAAQCETYLRSPEVYTHVTRPMQSDAAERVAAKMLGHLPEGG